MAKNNLFKINHFSTFELYIDSQDLPKESVCLVGSAVLAMRDMRENRDIDFVIHPSTYSELTIETTPSGIDVSKGTFEEIGIFDRELFLDESYTETVGEYRVVRPELVASLKNYKRTMRKGDTREKAKQDTDLYGQLSQSMESWDWSLVRGIDPYKITIESDTDTSLDPLPLRGMKSVYKNGVVYTVQEALRLVAEQLSFATSISDRLKQDIFSFPQPIPASQLLTPHDAAGELNSQNLAVLAAIRQDVIPFDHETNPQTDESVFVTAQGYVLNPEQLLDYIRNDVYTVPVEKSETGSASPDLYQDNSPEITAYAEEIEEVKEDIFVSAGCSTYVILWGPVSNVFEEIEQDLEEYFTIMSSVTYEMGNQLDDFVDKLYSIHGTNTFSREMKKHELSTASPMIRVIHVQQRPIFSAEQIFSRIERIKLSLRKKYHQKNDGVPWSAILHSPDTVSESKFIRNYFNNKK